MTKFNVDVGEEKFRSLVQKVSTICISEEFVALKTELEVTYQQCRMENAGMIAFQDALYALLAQEDGEQPLITSRAF